MMKSPAETLRTGASLVLCIAALVAARAKVEAEEGGDPAARRVEAYVDVLNAGDREAMVEYVRAHYDSAFLARIPADWAVAANRAPYYTSGGQGYELHSLLEPKDGAPGALLHNRLTGAWLELRLPSTGTPEYRINGFAGMTLTSPPDRAETSGRLSDEEMVERLTRCMARLVEDAEFSGVVLLARDGEPLFQRAYGLASKSYGVPNRVDTKFNIASLGKMFTGVAIAQLAERGALSFEDSIDKYVPADWLDPEVSRRIQVRHLLTHSSGLGDYFRKLYRQYDRLLFRGLADYRILVTRETPAFEPGSRFAYSNTGMLLAGVVIEGASGTTYYDYVQEHIFDPAGMTDTGFWDKDIPVPNRATGYLKEYTESGVQWRSNMVSRVMKGGPSGGSFSTAPDLLKFDAALRGHRLLSPEYTEIVLSGKPELNAPWCGYGFWVDDGQVGRIAQHSGNGAGISCEFVTYLDAGYAAIVLANYGRPAADIVKQAIHQMIVAW